MGAPLDLVGQRFGMLVATAAGVTTVGHRGWLCRCDCGVEVVVKTASLRNGNTKSCGCRKRAVLGESTTTHSGCGTPTWRAWKAMRARCSNPKAHRFHRYGGRGIRVCERWQDFANFLADMGEKPAGMTLDRRDNDSHYEPGNCRWATPAEQGANTSQNRQLTHAGKTDTLSGWARTLGLTPAGFWHRLTNYGENDERTWKPKL